MKWEYSVMYLPNDKLAMEELLRRLGQDGWEVAAAWKPESDIRVIFKRPSSENSGQ
jgi:hypothetical protein